MQHGTVRGVPGVQQVHEGGSEVYHGTVRGVPRVQQVQEGGERGLPWYRQGTRPDPEIPADVALSPHISHQEDDSRG